MSMTIRRDAVAPRIYAFILSIALSAIPVQTFSQTTGPSGTGNSLGPPEGAARSHDTVHPSVTSAVVRNLQAVRQECSGYNPVYRIDCVAQGWEDVLRRFPRGEYREARQVIINATNQLRAIAARNVDSAAPKQRSRGNARFKRAKTYSAVKRQNLRQAMQQAERVVAEAETRLLRSSENSDKRHNHYQQIAAAVGSTKVLMRSA